MKLPQFVVLALAAIACMAVTVPAGCASRADLPAQVEAQEPASAAVAGNGAEIPWPDLLLPERSFFAARASASSERKVFAHYMLCCGAFGSDVRAFRQDIELARSMGIDGFALNAGEWLRKDKDGRKTIPTRYKIAARAMFDAADRAGGFSLFFSADMANDLDAVDIADMIKSFGARPSYLKVDGRPVLSTYAADRAPGGPAFWRGLRQRLGVFLVPSAFPATPNETPTAPQVSALVEAWKGSVDGLFYFGAAGLPFRDAQRSLTASSEHYAAALNRAGKIYMAPYTPYYWGEKQPGRRYFEFEGGRGTAAQWKSIIEVAKPRWVEVITWNDPGETYIQPVDGHWSNVRFYDARVPFQNRRGYAELLRYYIAWFKSGQEPRIERDALFWFYRTQPLAANARAPWKEDTKGHLRLFEKPWRLSPNTSDQIYLTTALTAPAEIEVRSGDLVRRYHAPEGISHMAVPFAPGSQHFAVLRDGKAVAEGEGARIAAQVDYYNYWPASGYIVN